MRRKGRSLRRDGGGLPLAGVVLLEFGAIVAAVVLGFMVNEWREDSLCARKVETALASLAREMLHNHRSLEDVYAYHATILASLEDIPADQRTSTLRLSAPGLAGRQPTRPAFFDVLHAGEHREHRRSAMRARG